MSGTRNAIIFGLTTAPEATYGTAVEPTIDGFALLAEKTSFEEAWLNEGERGMSNISAGPLKRVRKSGRSYEAEIPLEMVGRPAALTGSTPPLYWHNLLLAAGFSGTHAGGVWTYEPISQNYLSLTIDNYVHRLVSAPGTHLRFRARGAYTTKWSIKAEAGGIVMGSFTIKGIGNVADETALPIFMNSVDTSTEPYKFDGSNNVASVLGAFKPVIRSWEISGETETQDRTDGNSAGSYAGLVMGTRKITGKMVIEMPAKTAFDWVAATEQNQTVNFALQAGSSAAAGNRLRIESPYCSIVGAKEGAEGALSTLELDFEFYGGGPGGNGDIKIIAS